MAQNQVKRKMTKFCAIRLTACFTQFNAWSAIQEGRVMTGNVEMICIHRFTDWKPALLGKREGVIEESKCKKCSYVKRRRAK